MIASSFYPQESYRILDVFNFLLKKDDPYNYIVIDLLCKDVDCIVRERGLLKEESCHIFRFPEKQVFK